MKTQVKKTNRFDSRHISYRHLGSFIEKIRVESKISVKELCAECNFGSNTYYRLIKGRDYPLNFYVRLLECFAAYCEQAHFHSLCHDFCLLIRAEMCAIRNLEMTAQTKEMWQKYQNRS